MIDLNFDYYEDTPQGEDPDSFSPTLNHHHKILWSKPLPNGKVFALESVTNDYGKLLLRHRSESGDYLLSSDMIIHSLFYSDDDGRSYSGKTAYAKWFPCEAIRGDIPDVVMDFWKYEIGISCYTVFPALQVERKQTINQARGIDRKICDRFDLTLECIRRYYEETKGSNPLYKTLVRYKGFFQLFDNFKGYVDFFHFQDLVESDFGSIKFWLPFDDFLRSPLPQSSSEYRQYKNSVCEFLEKRKKRISDSNWKAIEVC